MRRLTRNQKRSTTSNNDTKQSASKKKHIDESDETSSESDTEEKPPAIPKKKAKEKSDDSSSESDIENYLQKPDEMDFNSSFFQTQNTDESKSFDAIEKDIFSGANKLSDSESDTENEPKKTSQDEKSEEAKAIAHSSKLNFEQLHNYAKKLEEAKQMVKEYEARKKKMAKTEEKPIDDDITNLLSLGEMKVDEPEGFRKSIHSSDFESCSESEKEDWQEVEEGAEAPPASSVPKQGVEITVALPDTMKKKKGVDLVACMKRRLNRIKKENQILIHKVHLLCWIAHGNYVNKVLNAESLLGLSLSLIPSQHCYPPNRTDLTYLEQIVNWYKNTVTVTEKQISKQWSMEKVLKIQLTRKMAYNKKMLVYIFICILRSLGIQCRLVLSFQALPLRPPNSELHSLSLKSDTPSSSKTPKADELAQIEVNNEKRNSTTELNKDPDSPKNDDAAKDKRKTTTTSKKSSKTKQRLPKIVVEDEAKRKSTTELSKDPNSPKNDDTQKAKSDAAKDKRKTITTSKKTSKTKEISPKKVASDESTEEGAKKEKRKSTAQPKNAESQIADENDFKKEKQKRKSTENVFKTNSKDGQRVDLKNPLKKKPNLKNLKVEDTRKARPSKSTDKDKDSESDNKKPSTRASRSKKIAQLDGADDSSDDETVKKKKPNLKNLSLKPTACVKYHPKRLKSLPSYKEADEESGDCSNNNKEPRTKKSRTSSLSTPKSQRKFDIKNDIISIMKNRMKQQNETTHSKLAKNRRSKSQSDDDSDYAPEPIHKKHHSEDEFVEEKVKVKRRVKPKKEAEVPEVKGKIGHDVWAEVFLEAEEKWISVDVVKGAVHCVSGLHSRASHPISYIITWDNGNYVKDVTQRYCPNWNTTTRKLRVDPKWWGTTLRPYVGPKTARDKEEDEDLARLQLDKPLPSAISEYKNHPLYVLKRHLLKFEALYPPDPPPLGFIRKEPVYARECVHVLHSREIWMKDAKIVKLGEQPYKIVKARPKYDRLTGKMITDLPLEVFGVWQVEDYIPPTAENGIVPKNAYGNVELFKPCMIPKGTVHLKLPGLNKVARKMNIDTAPALVGFDFHSGWNHPVYDGYIVCQEFEDSLIAAWYMEQEEQEKREIEKREKRVYGNWKKLIKGLLIKQRLKAKYNFGEPEAEGSKGTKRKNKGPRFSTKKRRIGSDSESD